MKKYINWILIAVLFVCTLINSVDIYTLYEYGQPAVGVVQENMSSVVYLEIYGVTIRGGVERVGAASGVIVSEDGLVVTARHIVEHAVQIKVYLSDGREFITDKLYSYTKGDLGLIQVPKVRNLNAVDLGNYGDVQVGESVTVIGAPLGKKFNVTQGIVSHKTRGISYFGERLLMQVDAAAYPGNSGGPIFNSSGELIGILVGGARGTECLCLGMTVKSVKDMLDEYEDGNCSEAKELISVP